MNNEKEICICAAVKVDGRIFRGHRHPHCLEVMNQMLSWTMNRREICALNPEQGFVTSRDRYVGREEGYKLQIDAGIKSIAEGGYRGERLFSEDLY